MCGICGFIYRDKDRVASSVVIHQMVSELEHRGPDDKGIFQINNGCMGHTRLEVIDIHGGNQPMESADGKNILVFNGEIYNYRELAQRYMNSRSNPAYGDTRVLFDLLIAKQQSALPLLNGMFAFAYWDRKINRLILARDPVGQKPLYYYFDQQGLVFSSELGSLIRNPMVPTDLNAEAINNYLCYEYFGFNETPLKNVKKVPAGSIIDVDLSSWELKIIEYWVNPVLNHVSGISNDEYEEEFIEIFENAVERTLVADVETGIFLSGGLDSTAILKAASKYSDPGSINTFTITNEDRRLDEGELARESAKHFKTNHRELVLCNRGLRSKLELILGKLDEPIADPGLVALYDAVKFSRSSVKVMLSGNGGDELFAGYAPFRALWGYKVMRTLPAWFHNGVRRIFEELPVDDGYMGLGFKINRFLRGVGHHEAEVLTRWLSSFDDNDLRNLLGRSRESIMLSKDPVVGVPRLYSHLYDKYNKRHADSLISILLMFFQYQYLPGICSHSDKASMMCSQELRSPFLDTEVMKFANNLPDKMKYRNGKTKVIIRNYLRPNVMASIVNKQKKGFTVPLGRWLNNDLEGWTTELFEAMEETLGSIIDVKRAKAIWARHKSGGYGTTKQVWTLLVLQYWLLHTYSDWRGKSSSKLRV